jgi:excisionase family DNA binding protein
MTGGLTIHDGGLADSIGRRSRALTVNDVATLLNVSERQIYKLVSEHRIPSFKIGGSIRFDPPALALWLRQKMSPGSVGVSADDLRRRA